MGVGHSHGGTDTPTHTRELGSLPHYVPTWGDGWGKDEVFGEAL